MYMCPTTSAQALYIQKLQCTLFICLALTLFKASVALCPRNVHEGHWYRQHCTWQSNALHVPCATAAEGRSMLSRRDHHPWYPCIGMGWSAGLAQAVKAATALTGLRAKKLKDSATLFSNEWDYKCTTHNTNLHPNMRAHY